MYSQTHTHIHTCRQTHIHTHTHMHSHNHTYTGTHAQIHLHIFTSRHTHTHHTNRCTLTYTHTPIHMHSHTYTHTCTCSHTLYIFLSTSELQPRGRTSDAGLQELHCWVLRPWHLGATWSSPLGPGRASPLAQVTARQYPRWQFTIKAVQAWFDRRSCVRGLGGGTVRPPKGTQGKTVGHHEGSAGIDPGDQASSEPGEVRRKEEGCQERSGRVKGEGLEGDARQSGASTAPSPLTHAVHAPASREAGRAQRGTAQRGSTGEPR